jgi:decaprenyl-phosphate phosphoribosyltransferase
VRSARPQQWTKNVLVFAAPGTAGVLTQGPRLLDALIAFAAFCLAASGTYVLNDVLDRAEDLRHPRKRHRAIASGVVPLPLAVAWAAALFCAAGAVGLLARPAFLAVLAGYAILTLAYSAVLKHIAVVDIVAVGSGFLLRAIGGAVAVDVALSDWFLIVAIFGCIFLVTGKRHAEHLDLGADRGGHRRTLSRYPLSYLVHVRSVSAAVTIIAYCQWALARDGAGPPWAALSILPVVLGLFRYELLLEEGKGGMPDEVIRQDRPLQAIGLAWCVLLALQVYAT